MQSANSSQLYFKNYIQFGRYAIFAAGIGHTLFLIIFYYLGISPLVIINVFSVLIYAFCLKVLDKSLERNNFKLIGWLVYGELMGHAILASYFVGTHSGFHYYIVVLAVLPFLTFNDPKTVGIVKTLLIICVFSYIDVAMQGYIPPYAIEEVYATGLRAFNVSAFVSSAVVISVIYTSINYDVRKQLEHASTTDQLTGLYNRRLFTHLAEIEMKKIKRDGSTISLMMLDIDDFKKVNDEYGHTCGDEVLKIIAATIHETVRPNDIVSRWGGEEFVILLANTDLDRALTVAERLRMNIINRTVLCQDAEFSITVTLGLATHRDHNQSLDTLIEQADRAMYIGKSNGKNQSAVADY
ncbi:MAG: GGDEF domain-containing protein [Candidatus Thiodiazotropha sp.]